VIKGTRETRGTLNAALFPMRSAVNIVTDGKKSPSALQSKCQEGLEGRDGALT
jgi:hypothetical protein